MVYYILFSDCSLLVYRKIIDFYIDLITNSFLNIEVPILGVVLAKSSLSFFVYTSPGVALLQSLNDPFIPPKLKLSFMDWKKNLSILKIRSWSHAVPEVRNEELNTQLNPFAGIASSCLRLCRFGVKSGDW